MKRLTEQEKKQLGILIHYYRNQMFRSEHTNKDEFKQVNFCKGICSQAQLSRLEHGEPLKDQIIYEALLDKLNLRCEKVQLKDTIQIDRVFTELLQFQNDDHLIINTNQYIFLVNKFQNLFKNHIIYTHYSYALEFILYVLKEDYEEASYIIKDIIENLEILEPNYLVLTLHYLGIYYSRIGELDKANQKYLLCIEHMIKDNISNNLILIDTAENYFKLNKTILALDYLHKAKVLFDSTHNILILERLYRLYSIIYLKEGYYDECVENLQKARQFINNTNRKDLKSQLFWIQACACYLQNNTADCLSLLDESERIQPQVEQLLIRFIMNTKLEDSGQLIGFDRKSYEIIGEFYLIEEYKEEYFEKEVKPILHELPIELSVVIIKDFFIYLKSHIKYKKAVEIFEEFLA